MTTRNKILHLMNRYCFTIDTGDLNAWAELFAHGEWGLEGGTLFAGKAEVLKATENVRIYADGTPRTRHTTANVDLEIDEQSGTAKSECYVTVFQQTDDFPLQPIFSGYYFDEFALIEDEWRFRKRLIRYPLVGDMSAHLASPAIILPTT
jgi:hypothetical protein